VAATGPPAGGCGCHGRHGHHGADLREEKNIKLAPDTSVDFRSSGALGTPRKSLERIRINKKCRLHTGQSRRPSLRPIRWHIMIRGEGRTKINSSSVYFRSLKVSLDHVRCAETWLYVGRGWRAPPSEQLLEAKRSDCDEGGLAEESTCLEKHPPRSRFRKPYELFMRASLLWRAPAFITGNVKKERLSRRRAC
jgi:hypothetical protein